jgi:hypothetical protein
MASSLKVAAWIAVGLGFLTATATKLGASSWIPLALLVAGVVLGGADIALSRQLIIAGRFGGRVPITGVAAVLIGLGMIIAAVGVCCFFIVTKVAPGPDGRAWGGLAIMVLGSGLLCVGLGFWMKFAHEPWRHSAEQHLGTRLVMLLVRTWAFGWIGLCGIGLMFAGLTVLAKALSP